MKAILETRLIHWKKQWIHLIFWAAFPIIATFMVVMITNAVQEDTKVPVGIVLKENTPLVEELYDSIRTNPFIRVYELSEAEAIDQLNKHELDSVFVIRNGYEDKIYRGSRNRLLTGYESDLSFAYMPIKEVILSYVQQDAARAKATFVVDELSMKYADRHLWTWDQIIDKSKEIQVDQQLLDTSFSFLHKDTEDKGNEFTLIKPWNIWALFTLLGTLLLFDWIIKERRSSIMPRFSFLQFSLKSYLLRNLFLYTILLLFFDIIAIFSFSYFLDEPITWSIYGVIFFYRTLINMAAFLWALVMKNLFVFYGSSFLVTLIIAIGSGALLPIDGLIKRYPWIEWFNPLQAFLAMKYVNVWLIICIILITCWFLRKEKHHA
jgi:ABC-2 type transport system permease protein